MNQTKCAQCRGSGLTENGSRACAFCHGAGVSPKTKPPREEAIVKACMGWLRTLPVSTWEKRWQGGYAGAGQPDIQGTWHGRTVAAEVKQPGKKPTPLQQARLTELERAGAVALTVTSLSQLTEALTALGSPCTSCGLPVPSWAPSGHPHEVPVHA